MQSIMIFALFVALSVGELAGSPKPKLEGLLGEAWRASAFTS